MKQKFLLFIAFLFAFSVSYGQVYFEEGFENGLTGWGNVDADGDANIWILGTDGASGNSHSGTAYAYSESYINQVGPLTPDNWLISPMVDLSQAVGNVTLEYWFRAADQTWPSEYYACLLSETGDQTTDFVTTLLEETVTTSTDEANSLYVKRSIDLSAYAGDTVYLAWRHYDCTDNFRLNLDDIQVFANNAVDAGITDVTAPSNEASCALTNAEDVTITIFNYSGAAISDFDVSYSVDGGTTVTETVAQSIEPSTSYDYTFSQPVDLSSLGYYSLTAEVALTGDQDADNDSFTKNVSNGDAKITVSVISDSNGGQSWAIINSSGDTIATHGDYQWDVTETTDVCVLDDDCYSFNWSGGGSNTVTVSYNDTQVNMTTATGDYQVYPMGSGCAANDAEMMSVNLPDIGATGMMSIDGTLRNVGTSPIQSFDVTYTVDGGAASSVYSVSGLNIASSTTYDFSHDVQYDFGAGSHMVEVTIGNVNGMTDENTANNSASSSVFISDNGAQRKVMVMNFTTGVCPNCPPVHTLLEDYDANNPDNIVLIAHHSGFFTDDMTTTEDTELLALFNDGGSTFAPAVAVDRYFWGEEDAPGAAYFPSDGTDRIDTRYAVPTFVNVSLEGTHDPGSRMMEVTVSGEFTEDISGLMENMDLRVSLYVKEDSIVAAQSGDGGGDNYVHNNVMRAAISDVWGDSGVITDTGNGMTFSKTYTYTYNEAWRDDKLELVAFVNNHDTDPNNREVLNTVEVPVSALTLVNVETLNVSDFKLYPNPAQDVTYLDMYLNEATDVSVNLRDITGKQINLLTNQNYQAGNHKLELPLRDIPVGIYNVTIETEYGQLTQLLHIEK